MTTATDRLCNLRDLGGLPTTDGRTTRHGMLYRSEMPLAGDLCPDEVTRWPPATVLDLRAPMEWREVTNPLPDAGAEVVYLPLVADAVITAARTAPEPARHEAGAWFAERYRRWLRQRARTLARVVGICAFSPVPLLVHCSAGRDRTGVVVALLLAAAGIRRDAIVTDYRRTEANHGELVQRLVTRGVLRSEHDGRLPERPLATPEAIEATLDDLDLHPGGVLGWLVDHGADPGAVHAWRQRLVTGNSQ